LEDFDLKVPIFPLILLPGYPVKRLFSSGLPKREGMVSSAVEVKFFTVPALKKHAEREGGPEWRE